MRYLKLTTDYSKFLQPIDRIAWTLMLVLFLLIGILVWGGDRAAPKVRDFSWQNKKVGAEDNRFILTFTRPMEHASVEANLHINPPLPGKFSWAGRRMAYTLTSPVRYDTIYKVELRKAQQGTSIGKTGKPIQPFVGQFRTRDRAFVYLGIEGEEKGRLILYNLTQNQKIILTPKNQVVINFKPYPAGDRILFSAADWLNYGPGLSEQQLYTVTTGIPPESFSHTDPAPIAGKVNLVLDSQEYQNLKFDLSPDGQVIVVFRVKRNNLKDSSLWILRPDASPQSLKNPPGGEFLIAPDSASLALLLPDGVDILPLTPSASPLEFLPQYDRVLSFAKTGLAAAMVKFNSDSTQSLFLVPNQGQAKELLRTSGDRLNCQFDPSSPVLYCLVAQQAQGENYHEQQNLVAIDLKTFQVKQLLPLTNQRDIQMSLSPDGLALLLDRVVTQKTLPKKEDLTTDLGAAITTSHLWLLPLPSNHSAFTNQLQPQELPLLGFHPVWLP